MTGKADITKDRILACARNEFLAKGFRDASLRIIAKSAGVTTGAIYRYFPDKDALFSVGTQNVADAIRNAYGIMIGDAFDALDNGIPYSKETGQSNMQALVGIIYDNFEEFYLIIMRADGSSRDGFMHDFLELEVKNTLAYLETLKKRHGSSYAIDETSLHLLSEAYLGAMLEPVRHRMEKQDAMRQLAFLSEFFADGWRSFEQKIIKN